MEQAPLADILEQCNATSDDLQRRILLASPTLTATELAELADFVHDLRRTRQDELQGERKMFDRRH